MYSCTELVLVRSRRLASAVEYSSSSRPIPAASAQIRAPKFVQGAAPSVQGADGGSAMFAVSGPWSSRLRLSPPALAMHATAPRMQDSDSDQGGVTAINAPTATGPGSALKHPALHMSLPGAPSQTRLLISPPALAVRETTSSPTVQDVDSTTTITDTSQADSRHRQREQLRGALRLERHAVAEHGPTSDGSLATLKRPSLAMSLPAMPSQARLLISSPALSESRAIDNTAESGKDGVQENVAAGDGHGRGSQLVAVEHGPTSDGSASHAEASCRVHELTNIISFDTFWACGTAQHGRADKCGASTRSRTATRAKILLRVRQQRQETDAMQDLTRDLAAATPRTVLIASGLGTARTQTIP